MSPLRFSLLTMTALLSAGSAAAICTSDTNTFTVQLDLHASELGYFRFEECGDETNPTLGMEVGQTYTFVQSDRTNYYHPMGFAYFPDGAHDNVDELEPGIAQGSDKSCAATMSCPAPMYYLNGNYLGDYSNLPEGNKTVGKEDFGLDHYEPLFFHPMPDWIGMGTFEVKLNFDDASYAQDIFYFCHIHQFMSGRIKLLKDGVAISPVDVPSLGYEYEAPGEFDRTCGTYGLDEFQLPHEQCPSHFVCDASEASQPFAGCIDAMDCHMMVGMTTKVSSQSDVALFIHQMIPHHQNAVNMAKALLHANGAKCDDLTNDEDPLCVLQVILYEIVNGQNHQIQLMQGILEALDLPATDDCEVVIPTEGDRQSRGLAATATGALFGAAAHLF